MLNAVFWDIKPSSYLTGDIISTLQSIVCSSYARYEVFTAVAMKNVVVWDVTPCGCCKNRRFADYFHFDNGDAFLRNVGSHNSHTAQIPEDSILQPHYDYCL
jgi:hypothetical protein